MSNWSPRGAQPPQHGYILDGGDPHKVSFKAGGPQGDRTLIADGHVDKETFDGTKHNRGHNDYGSRREGPGYIDEDRGKYTGPNH